MNQVRIQKIQKGAMRHWPAIKMLLIIIIIITSTKNYVSALSQDYWMVATHVNMKNAGKPRVLAINALQHSVAAFVAAFRAGAVFCYL